MLKCVNLKLVNIIDQLPLEIDLHTNHNYIPVNMTNKTMIKLWLLILHYVIN